MGRRVPRSHHRGRKSRKARSDRKLATVAKVKRLIKADDEVKDFIASAVNSQATWSGTIINLTGVTQGNAITQRVGDKLMPTSLELRYIVGQSIVTSRIRVIVFRWTAKLAGNPFVNYILAHNTSVLSVLSPYQVPTRSDFNILYDRTYQLDANNYGKVKTVKLKLAKKPVIYDSGSSTDSSNKICLLFISDIDPAVPANQPVYTYYTRFYYTDA